MLNVLHSSQVKLLIPFVLLMGRDVSIILEYADSIVVLIMSAMDSKHQMVPAWVIPMEYVHRDNVNMLPISTILTKYVRNIIEPVLLMGMVVNSKPLVKIWLPSNHVLLRVVVSGNKHVKPPNNNVIN